MEAAKQHPEADTPELDSWHLRGLTEASRSRLGMRRDNLVLFDWDDTLLSTSAINRGFSDPERLRNLRHVTEVALRTAMRFGETIIVTNGNASWVQDSAKRHMPELLPLLSELKVISARAQFENEHPGNPFAWKRRAFREVVEPWHRFKVATQSSNAARGRSPAVNLVVIGDASYEIEAAEGLKKTLTVGSLVKTVKLIETPTLEALMGQLRRVAAQFPAVMAAQKCCSMSTVQSGADSTVSEVQCWMLKDKSEPDPLPKLLEDPSPLGQIISTGFFDWMFQIIPDADVVDSFEQKLARKETESFKYLSDQPALGAPWQN